MSKQLIYVALTRLFSTSSSLLLSLVGATMLTERDFGKLTFFLTFVAWLSVIQRFGLDRLTLRLIAGTNKYESKKEFLKNAIIIWSSVQIVLMIICVALSTMSHLSGLYFFESIGISWEFLFASTLLSLIFVYSDVLRACDYICTGLIISGVVTPTVVSIYILLVPDLYVRNIVLVYCVSSLVLLAFAIYFVSARCKLGLSRPFRLVGKKSVLLIESGNIMLHSLAVVGVAAFPIIALGFLHGSEVVARYQKSFLVAMVIGSVSLIISAVLEPKFAKYHQLKSSLETERQVAKAQSFVYVVAGFGVMYTVMASAALNKYPEYGVEMLPSIILCLSQLVNLLTTPYQASFLMSGQAKLVKVASLLTFLLVAILLPFFAMYHPLIGGASAVLLAMIVKFAFYFHTSRS